jgi:energy-coupling factor transporter transmembrane protein EcfT
LPEIIHEAKQSRDAQQARCIELRKNIVCKTIWRVIPLLRRSFERAEKIAIAMESRGYSENRALARVPLKVSDLRILMIVISALALSMML